MGLVLFPTWKPYKTTIHVGKYTSPMDGMGNHPCIFTQHHQETLEANIAFEDEEGLEATNRAHHCAGLVQHVFFHGNDGNLLDSHGFTKGPKFIW